MTDIGATFRALHQPGNPFVLMNVWDAGSAKVAAGLGAQALGTTSDGQAFTLGKLDMGEVTRDEALAHAEVIVSATSLPVSGDFENGYGDDPDYVADTIRFAAEAGLAGCSIEDTNMADHSAYDFDLAVERVRAAASAARSLRSDFVFVARADGVMNEVYDMDEAVRRIRAFDEAGADCLYVPMPPSIEDVARVCQATTKPVNAIAAGKFAKVSRDDFAAAGVGRISLGSALSKVTHAALLKAAKGILNDGDFSELLNGASSEEVEALLTHDRG
ncbi:MAG: isocitrate lyase/phosphoenolpyruvate mutase family protein [Pseudomonadota bacterium]